MSSWVGKARDRVSGSEACPPLHLQENWWARRRFVGFPGELLWPPAPELTYRRPGVPPPPVGSRTRAPPVTAPPGRWGGAPWAPTPAENAQPRWPALRI